MRLFERLSSYAQFPFHKRSATGEELSLSCGWADGVRTIYDENTGLYWEVKSPDAGEVNYGGARYTFAGAGEVHAAELNAARYGGFDDWRIPNKDELRSIFDYGRADSVIDTDIFGDCPVGDYWTKNVYRLQPYFSWFCFPVWEAPWRNGRIWKIMFWPCAAEMTVVSESRTQAVSMTTATARLRTK